MTSHEAVRVTCAESFTDSDMACVRFRGGVQSEKQERDRKRERWSYQLRDRDRERGLERIFKVLVFLEREIERELLYLALSFMNFYFLINGIEGSNSWFFPPQKKKKNIRLFFSLASWICFNVFDLIRFLQDGKSTRDYLISSPSRTVL